MSILDIRNPVTVPTAIRFSDVGYGHASRIIKVDSQIKLADIDGEAEALVKSEDIANLVLALKKAKELGW